MHVRAPYFVARVLVVWLIMGLSLFILSGVLNGFDVDDFAGALVAAAIIGILNALLWPLIVRIALPFTVLTLGLGALVLNGVIVLIASELDSGIKLDGLGSAIVLAIGLTAVNTILTTLFAVDDEDFWYRNVVRRAARRNLAESADTDVPGVYFLEIDGLGHDVLVRAIRDGNAPTLARWVHDGDHKLVGWETDWSSQTGACQAGLLHGNNDDMPAFRWWEKDRGKAIVTNHPRDAAEMERRISNGRGLLHEDGASRANILSGDAKHTMLTMSTVLDRGRGRIGKDYYGYFANPYSATRTLVLAIADIAQELRYASQQRRRDVQPRIKRTFSYALVRAWGTVVQRDLQVAAVIADMYAGRPVGYTTFLAYDEVAHHSGIERADALSTLLKVDRQIARIVAAAKHAPRPYEFVVLSDHGQSQGATFLDRYDETLEDLVQRECGAADSEVAAEGGGSDEARAYLGAGLAEAATQPGRTGRAVDRATRTTDVRKEIESASGDKEDLPELSVMASGCLGLITFPREPGRVTLEQIEAKWPRLLPALTGHDGIGFALVRSERDGAVVLGANGRRFLADDRVEGDDPLAPFGPRAADHVRRTDGFAHCPDIVLNSTFWADTEEVAAFEQLVGSHGGMGGGQSHPFALYPGGWAKPEGELVGAEHVHRQLRRWLADAGHEAYET